MSDIDDNLAYLADRFFANNRAKGDMIYSCEEPDELIAVLSNCSEDVLRKIEVALCIDDESIYGETEYIRSLYGESIRESRASSKKIPYDLVSSLAILRDYDVLEDSDYINEEHRLLVDIADSIFNVGQSVVKNFKPEYKEVYDAYGKAYFSKVLKDMRALDSQISDGNINDLIDEVNDKLSAF